MMMVINLDVSLSEECVIAIRHGVVELHSELQTLATKPLVQHYTAVNRHSNVCETTGVEM